MEYFSGLGLDRSIRKVIRTGYFRYTPLFVNNEIRSFDTPTIRRCLYIVRNSFDKMFLQTPCNLLYFCSKKKYHEESRKYTLRGPSFVTYVSKGLCEVTHFDSNILMTLKLLTRKWFTFSHEDFMKLFILVGEKINRTRYLKYIYGNYEITSNLYLKVSHHSDT